jgi:hypothetical protein
MILRDRSRATLLSSCSKTLSRDETEFEFVDNFCFRFHTVLLNGIYFVNIMNSTPKLAENLESTIIRSINSKR